MTHPNLFIVGAPKCGTTSLAHWLSQHDQVYLPRIKEPHYFSKDIYQPDPISESQYLQLYVGRQERIKVDASTRYLYSREAVEEIAKKWRSAKFIAMVRDPVELVRSLHNHLVFLGVEHIDDFEEAWRACDHRRRGKMIKAGCADPDSLLYDEIGLLGRQIDRLFQVVPPERRMVIVFDDLRKRPREVLSEVFDFLELPDDVVVDPKPMNRSMVRRSEWLFKFMQLAAAVKSVSGVKTEFGILNYLKKINKKEQARAPVSPDVREMLEEAFSRDIQFLGSLIGRDLKGWGGVQESCKTAVGSDGGLGSR